MSFDFLNSIERTATLRRNERADFENQFLSGFRVPAEANRLRLQSKQSRFDESVLDATKDEKFQYEVQKSKNNRIQSEIDFSTKTRNLEYEKKFGQTQYDLDAANLQLDELEARQELQFNKDFIKENRRLKELEIQDEIKRYEDSIKERESKIEANLFDKQFESLLKAAGSQQFERKGDRFSYMYEASEAEGFSKSVRDRIDLSYIEASAPQLETVALFNDALVVSKGKAGTTYENNRVTNLSQLNFGVEQLDPSFLKLGLSRGTLKTSDLGPLITTALEKTDDENFHTVLKGLIEGSKRTGANIIPIMKMRGDEIVQGLIEGRSFVDSVLLSEEPVVEGPVDETVTPEDQIAGTEEALQPEQPGQAEPNAPVTADAVGSLSQIPDITQDVQPNDQGIEDEESKTVPATVDAIGSLSEIPDISEEAPNAETTDTANEEIDLSKPLNGDKVSSFLEIEPSLRPEYKTRLEEASTLIKVTDPEFDDLIDRIEQLEDLQKNYSEEFDLDSFLEIQPVVTNEYQEDLKKAIDMIGNDRNSEQYQKLLEKIIELEELERT